VTVDDYLVSHEMGEFLDELGIEHKKTIPLWPRANKEVDGKINCYSRQCVQHKLKENHGNKSYRNIFLAYRSTPQHLNTSHHNWCQPCRTIVWKENPNQDAGVRK